MNPEQYPLGIMPEEIWKWNRFDELGKAINRYVERKLHIPEYWIAEYNKLRKELTGR